MSTLPELVPDFDLIISTVLLVANQNNPLVGGNSSRFGILFSIPVANLVYVLPRAMTASAQGLALAAGFQSLYFNFRDHGVMPARDWHSWTTVPGQSIVIIEIVYKPK